MRQYRILAILLSAFACSIASAQNYTDVLGICEKDYINSSKSMGMSNAVTAVGGEVGMMGINPAGAAVSDYSQVVISMGADIASTYCGGTYDPSTSSVSCFQNGTTQTSARFTLPAIGFIYSLNTGNYTGLISVNLGYASHVVANRIENCQASGIQDRTSMAGYMASRATGTDYHNFSLENAWEYQDWISLQGYKSNTFTLIDGTTNRYLGATEKMTVTGKDTVLRVAGSLDQGLSRVISSDKRDHVFNLSFNISDKVYLGANLGISSYNYTEDMSISEKARLDQSGQNPFVKEFEGGTTYFNNLVHNCVYTVSGLGVYGKFGVIYTPLDFLRLGFAVETPMKYDMREYTYYNTKCVYDNSKYSGSCTSPTGSNYYYLTSPWRFNFGVAATLWSMALISVDYEFADYSGASFTSRYIGTSYDELNSNVKNYLDFCHNPRAGVEVLVGENFAVRAGYSGIFGGEKRYQTSRNSFSLGMGYDGGKWITADLGFKATKYDDQYIHPYADYINGVYSPELQVSRWGFIVTASVGFRF